MSDNEITSPAPPESITQMLDSLRYASTVVSIGISPDDPECIASKILVLDRRVCLHHVAEILRGYASRLEEQHSEGGCPK